MAKPVSARWAIRGVVSAALVAFATVSPASGAELLVSAAASLTNAFRDIGKVFEAGHVGSRVVFNFAATDYIVNWVFFTVVSLLPLAVAIVLLLVAREWAERLLEGVRRWLDGNARTIAAVIIVALAASLIRNGIAGLTA